jgi:hypothetical protein
VGVLQMVQPNVDYNKIRAKNKQNIKALKKPNLSINYLFGGINKKFVLLIGNHDAPLMNALRQNNDSLMTGTITVTKGTMFEGPGEFKITGNKGRRREMQDELELFSRKKITWA